MPGMTGIDLATKLQAIHIEIPVVLCTADHDLIERQSQALIEYQAFDQQTN